VRLAGLGLLAAFPRLAFSLVLGLVAGGRAEGAGDHAASRGGQVNLPGRRGQLHPQGVVQVDHVF